MDIPEWEGLWYSSLAREWAKSTRPYENWEARLQEREPGDLERCLQGIPIKLGKELAEVYRRGWILLTGYSIMCKSRDEPLKKKIQMEKELVFMGILSFQALL